MVYIGGTSSYLTTAPAEMYQASLITAAGGVNAGAGIAGTSWTEISYEQLLAMDPDIIVVPTNSFATAAPDYTVDDTSTAILRLENGAQFVVQTLFNVPDSAAAWHFDLFGTKGRLLGKGIIGQEDGGNLNAVLLSDSDDPFGETRPGTFMEADFRNLYTEEIERFSLSVLNGTAVDIPPETAWEAQKVIDAAYESSRTGITIAL